MRPGASLPPFSERLIRLVGVEEARSIQLAIRKPHARTFVGLAGADDDPARAHRHLLEAFDIAAIGSFWPDYSDLVMVVEASVALGHRGLASVLAERVVALADVKPSAFRILDHV